MDHDWVAVRRAVKRAKPHAYLLGEQLPASLSEALRQQKIKAMQGVRVATRNNTRTPQGRLCDIYLTEGDE